VVADTTLWGRPLIAEQVGKQYSGLVPVGTDSEDYAVNYTEISKEEWMEHFS